jgi:hypothetical protein
MNLTWGRLWTQEEDDIVRRDYVRLGSKVLAKTLDRTFAAVQRRAENLGVNARPRWSDEDDRTLRLLWGEKTTRGIAAMLKRSQDAVYERARILGLVREQRIGKERLSDAERRTGFSRRQLRRILREAGVLTPLVNRSEGGNNPAPAYNIDTFDVDEAIAEVTKKESVNAAARRRGITAASLTRALKKIGVERPATLPKRHLWRVDDDAVERAIAARRASA